MKSSTSVQTYSTGSKLLHWLILALLVIQYTLGWTMPDIHKGTVPSGLIAWHLSIGTLILLAVIIRLVWRWMTPIPPSPDSIPRVLQWLSRLTHFALYFILLILPFMGWANASARGWTVTLFGTIALPALVKTGSPFGRALGGIHGTTAIILLVVIGLHVCAAFYHQWVLRDGLLRRMWFSAARAP